MEILAFAGAGMVAGLFLLAPLALLFLLKLAARRRGADVAPPTGAAASATPASGADEVGAAMEILLAAVDRGARRKLFGRELERMVDERSRSLTMPWATPAPKP